MKEKPDMNEKEAILKNLEKVLVGVSENVRRVRDQIYRASQTDLSVLIDGDSGTGKQIVAEQIHKLSRRKERRFVHIICPSLPSDKFESELFGAKGRRFTNVDDHHGKVMAADKGTLFLDEIGALPASTQVKLLGLLDNKKFYRLGDTKESSCEFRLICATNRDILSRIYHQRWWGDDYGEGMEYDFRPDLYYRISEHEINLTPLNGRREDILPILVHLLAEHHGDIPKGEWTLTFPALYSIIARDWNGNVRELQKLVKTSELCSEKGKITLRYEGKTDISEYCEKQGLTNPESAGWGFEMINLLELDEQWKKEAVTTSLPFEDRLRELAKKCESLPRYKRLVKADRQRIRKEKLVKQRARAETVKTSEPPPWESSPSPAPKPPEPKLGLEKLASKPTPLRDIEALYLEEVRKQHPFEYRKRGNSRETLAKKLGISSETLKKKIAKLKKRKPKGG